MTVEAATSLHNCSKHIYQDAASRAVVVGIASAKLTLAHISLPLQYLRLYSNPYPKLFFASIPQDSTPAQNSSNLYPRLYPFPRFFLPLHEESISTAKSYRYLYLKSLLLPPCSSTLNYFFPSPRIRMLSSIKNLTLTPDKNSSPSTPLP